MYELPLTNAFNNFAEQPDSALDGALLVGRVIDPELDAFWVRGELARLAADVGHDANANGLIAFLNAQGFAGAETYYNSENSSLEHVLRTRRGIPISLAVVVLGVAAELGLEATGINFPQHFLVAVDGVLADPFRMSVIDPAERRALLARLGVSPEQAFPAASPLDIVLRMLNNLRVLALQVGDHARALDYSGYQVLIAPEPFPFHVERVDLWLAAGVPDMARHELDIALALAPSAELRAELGKRRALIATAPTRLH